MPDYLVQVQSKPTVDATPTLVERLVRAKNQPTAIAHIVNDTITVKLAETEDIVRCAKAGVDLEHAE